MALVVFVHGMRHERKDEQRLLKEWREGLLASLASTEWGRANPGALASDDISLVYWATLFQDAPTEPTKGFTESYDGYCDLLRSLLRAYDEWADFTDAGEPANLFASAVDGIVHQAAMYMNNAPGRRLNPSVGPGVYEQVQDLAEKEIVQNPVVVIGHSLGSVIAYEALYRLTHRVHTLITVGSPIGTPRLIYDRLRPRGRKLRPWPGVKRWVNVSAVADIWSVPVQRIQPLFEGDVEDQVVRHGSLRDFKGTHDLKSYFVHPIIGEAVAKALSETSPTDRRRPTASPRTGE